MSHALNRSQQQSGSRFHSLTVVLPIALFVVHLAFVLWLMPISCLFTPEPIEALGYIAHYDQAVNFQTFWAQDTRSWGYVTNWAAGYPVNVVEGGNQSVAVATYLLASLGLPLASAFKIFVFLQLLSAPLFVYWAARNFRLAPAASLVVLAAAIALFDFSIYFRTMISLGMFSYGFITMFAPYVLSVFYVSVERGGVLNIVWLCVVLAFALLVHLVTTLVVGLPMAILFLFRFVRSKQDRWRLVMVSALAVLAAGLVNAFWLIPYVRYAHHDWEVPSVPTVGSMPVFVGYLFTLILMTPGILPIVLTSVRGLERWVHGEQRDLAWVFGGSAFFFLILGLLGPYISILRNTAPMRFHIDVTLALIFPGASGLVAYFAERYPKRQGRVGRWRLAWVGTVLSIVLPLGLLFGLVVGAGQTDDPILQTFATWITRRLNVSPDRNTEFMELVDWLETNTTPEGRILVETALPTTFAEEKDYVYSLAEDLLPLYIEREFVGGPQDGYRLGPYYFSAFLPMYNETGQLLDQIMLFSTDLDEMTPARLQDYFDLYNVKWVMALSDIAVGFFDQMPGYLTRVATFNQVVLYQVDRAPSFFEQGNGRVKVLPNRLILEGLSGEEVVLRYHWIETLRTDPETPIEPIYLLDDPVPFIRLVAPPESLVIYNGY